MKTLKVFKNGCGNQNWKLPDIGSDVGNDVESDANNNVKGVI